MEKMFKSLSISEFHAKFPDKESCYLYLEDIKWKNGFICPKCGHTHHCNGQKKHIRKCTKCNHQDSVTAGTLFHKVKFDLLKAFQILYFLSTTKKGMASTELSRKVGLRQKTCWLFKRKVMEAMKSSDKYILDGEIEVDEFVIGGQEEGVKGRKKGTKRLVVVAIERKKKGIGRAYAKVIANAGKKEIAPFFDKKIDKQATIKTDKFRTYTALKKDYTNLTQIESGKKGKNFPIMHRWIMGMKGWLRGIHHHARDLQAYLDEYCYRYNRHFMKENIFDNLVLKMMNGKPKTYLQLVGN